MTVVRLHHHAPEAQNAITCGVCGTADAREVTDHIQVGTPGTPQHDEGVCTACGRVLNNVVEKYGSSLTVMIDDAQQEASDREITTPGTHPHQPETRSS